MFAASKTNTPSGGTSDPQFNYVTMLLHGDGTNGAQNNTFVDSSTNNYTITRTGNTTQGSFSPYGSNWSNFNPDSNNGLGVATNTALNMGTGDFTVEAWVNTAKLPTTNAFQTSSGGYQCVFGTGPSNSATGTQLYIGVTNLKFDISADGNGPIDVAHNMVAGQWYHVAISRSSTTFKAFINGSLVQTATSASSWTDGYNYGIMRAEPIGSYDGAWWYGYVSNFRVVKGTAVYTSSFTPSTTPLTAISGTSLLTCQSNRFIDNSSNNFTISVNNSPSVQRFNPFGASTAYSTSVIGGSGYFDGSGDYLVTSGTGSFNPRSTFTVEFWTYPISNNTVTWINSNTNNSFYFETNGTDLFIGDGIINTIGTSAPKVNQWTHMLLSFDGTTYRLFYNGSLQASSTSLLQSTTISAFRIGQKQEGTRSFNGYITDMRVLVGTALYTSAFTPPIAPITAITNTSLLLNYTNGAIFDNAMMNDLETVGNAQISTSVVKYGTGSLKFNGTTDYLTLPSAPTNQMGKGPFTIEAWIYPTTISGTQTIVGKYVGGSIANSEYWLLVNSSGKLAFVIDGSGGEDYIESAAGAISANTWTYVAAIRTPTAIAIYINGSLAASVGSTVSSTSVNTTPLNIGSYNNGLGLFTGYIDELRITKGVARYSGSSFTTPTAAFPNTGPI